MSIKESYNKIYAGYGDPNVRELPEIFAEDHKNIFFWSHLRFVRTGGKNLPTKIRRKLKPEEWANLKRDIEMIAHQARYALAYIEKNGRCMKENLTSINVLLDGSGSMASLVNDTIGGFNAFLADQQALPGEATLSLSVFNTNNHVIHDCAPIKSVSPLDKKVYKTAGGTALLDSLGSAIDNVGKKLSEMKEEDRPAKILFLIITDGEENSSHLLSEEFLRIKKDVDFKAARGQGHYGYGTPKLRYPFARIKEMVEHQQSKYNWEFVFMGANIDAITGGASLGIKNKNTLQYTPSAAGTRELYETVSQSTKKFRDSSTKRSGFFDK